MYTFTPSIRRERSDDLEIVLFRILLISFIICVYNIRTKHMEKEYSKFKKSIVCAVFNNKFMSFFIKVPQTPLRSSKAGEWTILKGLGVFGSFKLFLSCIEYNII